MFWGAQHTLNVYSHIILLEYKYIKEEAAVSIDWTMQLPQILLFILKKENIIKLLSLHFYDLKF